MYQNERARKGSIICASVLRAEGDGAIKEKPLGSKDIIFSSPTHILYTFFWAIVVPKQHNKDPWNTCKDQMEERAEPGTPRSCFRLGEASAADIRQPFVWETAFVLPHQGCHSRRDAPAGEPTPQGSSPVLLHRKSLAEPRWSQTAPPQAGGTSQASEPPGSMRAHSPEHRSPPTEHHFQGDQL